MIRILLPIKLKELWQMMEEQPQAMIYAGGTDLLIKLRQRLVNPSSLVCLERIEKLKGVQEQKHEIVIGACTSHTFLLENRLIQKHFPVLIKALKELGSPPIRNMGTIGGNICTASPAADTLTPLYVLKAEVEIQSKDAFRRTALKDFIWGSGQTRLQAGEVVSKIYLKKDMDYNIHHFEKVGQRKALSISLVSMAAVLKVSNLGIVEKARLAWGSVAPTVVTSDEIEEFLIGKHLSRETIQSAAILVRKAVKPIDDIRGSASYRRMVAGNLLWRLLET